MPEKEIYHDQIQIHQFHHAADGGVIGDNTPSSSCVYPFHIPSAFIAFHTPSPFSSCIDHRSHDNRFLWNPGNPSTGYHPITHK